MNEIEKDFHRVMFRRVHRSYIVNMNYAEDIKSSYVVVGGKKIPVSRSKKENMLA